MKGFFLLIYGLIALRFFTLWFAAFKQDTRLSAAQIRHSWLVLVVATGLWPLAALFCYLELVRGKGRRRLGSRT